MRSEDDGGPRRNLGRMLDFLVRSVPWMEPPPFFAQRVSHLVNVERFSFVASLQAFARRFVPVFMTLVVAVCFLVYRSTESDPLLESELFFEGNSSAEVSTIEDVLLILPPLSGTGNENE